MVSVTIPCGKCFRRNDTNIPRLNLQDLTLECGNLHGDRIQDTALGGIKAASNPAARFPAALEHKGRRNAEVDHLRHLRVLHSEPVVPLETLLHEPPSLDPEHDDNYDLIVAKVDPLTASILCLRLDGYSLQEIASALTISKQIVSRRITRARSLLYEKNLQIRAETAIKNPS